MIELPDDELDKLFRKSSEELDPTYEPEDWNALRKRLDQQDGKTPAGWWRKWWPLGVLALLIPAGIALYSWYGGKEAAVGKKAAMDKEPAGSHAAQYPRENGERRASQAPVTTDEPALTAAETKPVTGKTANAEIDHADIKATDTQKALKLKSKASAKETGKSSSISDLNAASAKSSASLPRSRSKAGGVYLEPNRSKVEGGDGASFITGNASQSAGGGRSTPSAQPGAVSDASPDAFTANTAASAAQSREPARTLISASELGSKSLKWNALLLPGIIAPVEIAPLAEPEETRPPKHSDMSADDQPLMAVRFGYSPDLSTVGLKNFSKPGTAVSLLVEYSILPKTYLQSGAVWSRKVYGAAADAYHLPKMGHYYPPAMTSVDGVCNVLEIPLNVRYDFATGERSRWLATGGFSSYHMNKEKYNYHFVDENDPKIQYRYWKGKTGWYWLSHANISLGYEYRISKKLSLLAEPSIRMPLKRVGYGKVNLITTGLWLSVRYTPVFK